MRATDDLGLGDSPGSLITILWSNNSINLGQCRALKGQPMLSIGSHNNLFTRLINISKYVCLIPANPGTEGLYK